jgi:hypothetical protein
VLRSEFHFPHKNQSAAFDVASGIATIAEVMVTIFTLVQFRFYSSHPYSRRIKPPSLIMVEYS